MHLKKTQYVYAVGWSPRWLMVPGCAALWAGPALLDFQVLEVQFWALLGRQRGCCTLPVHALRCPPAFQHGFSFWKVSLRCAVIASASCYRSRWSAAPFSPLSHPQHFELRKHQEGRGDGCVWELWRWHTGLGGKQARHVGAAWLVWMAWVELAMSAPGAAVLADPCGPGSSCSCCWPGQLRGRHWNEVSSIQ